MPGEPKKLVNPHLLKAQPKAAKKPTPPLEASPSPPQATNPPSTQIRSTHAIEPTKIGTPSHSPTNPPIGTELDAKALDLTLLSNFVHQVINPLNGVIGTLDNVIDGTVSGSRRDQRLRVVRAQLEWTVMLVRNLAYFAGTSLTPGTHRSIEIKKCVIPELVIEAAQFFQEIAATQQMDVELMDKSHQYTVEGSPDLLRQVFMNLIDNAVKYSDPRTKIEIVPWVQKHTNDLIIEVKNKGAGFRADEREHLFDVGYRGEEAKARVKSGTGLGLYICRRIMTDIHHGSIEAEYSVKLQTTTLRLRFPKWRIG